MSNKNDLRVRTTKKMLRQSFAQLMSEKPLQNISVAELCQRAGINRSTFYAHYADIFDLQQKLEDEIFDEFQETLAQVSSMDDFSTEKVPLFMVTLFDFIKRNADMCNVFIGPHSDRRFVLTLLDNAKETAMIQYGMIYKKATSRQLERLYTFIAFGCIGLLEDWLKNGLEESVEEMAHITNLLIARGSSFLEES